MYNILDEFGDLHDEYKEQDRMMRDAASLYRRWLPNYKTWSMVFVDDDEAMHLLGYLGEDKYKDWARSLETLEFDLRLTCGTDIIGLSEYIEFEGLTIAYILPYASPLDLWPGLYDAHIYDNDGKLYWGDGWTRLEALANAYIEYKELT